MGNRRVAGKVERAPTPTPDKAAMAAAVRDFLRAAGLSQAADPNLAQTPERVAEAWASEFLGGYAQTPEEALGARIDVPPGSSGELVVVTDLRFQSMCPHHLLPIEGRAHVAYVPSQWMVGFGRLGSLVDCFARRLILQEELAREVAASLARVLHSPATACIIEAEQACLRIRGARQRDARTHAEAYEGKLRRDGAMRRELWTRLALPRR